MGETCGLKLVYDTRREGDICKLCHDTEKKQRRLDKMYRDVERWHREGNRRATIERTNGEIREVSEQIYRMREEHHSRISSLGQVRVENNPSPAAADGCLLCGCRLPFRITEADKKPTCSNAKVGRA